MDTERDMALLDNQPSGRSTSATPITTGANFQSANSQSVAQSDDTLNVSSKPQHNNTTQNNKAKAAPDTAGAKAVHKGTKQETKWDLNRLLNDSLMDDEGRISNGWRYSFDLNDPKEGTVSLSNGSFKLIYEKVSHDEKNNNLKKIKNLIFKMHNEVDPEQHCKQLMELLKNNIGKDPDVVEDTNPDVMESLASELIPMLNRINENATEPNDEGQDFLQVVDVDNVKRDVRFTDKTAVTAANANAYNSLSSNISIDEMEKNPELFYLEKFESRKTHVREITIKKLHGDKQKSDSTLTGNWDSVTLEQKDGALFARVNAQKHIGFKSNFIERRTYGIQRWIEDKIVNRMERLADGLTGLVNLVPKSFRKWILDNIQRRYPEYDPKKANKLFSKVAPYLACAAIATLAVTTLPITAPYVASVFSALTPYASSAIGFVSPYAASASAWLSTTFPQVGTALSALSPYVGTASSWFGTTFPGTSGLILQGLSSLAANGAIAGCIATPFFLTTRLGAKTIGGFGKLTTKLFSKNEPTTISFKIAELDPDEDMGSLMSGDGKKILEKVEKVLDLLSKDKVTAAPEKKEQFKQLLTGSYVQTNRDSISRSSLIEQLLADDTMNLGEINNAELSGLRWFGMGEHPGSVWKNCRSIDCNFYIFDADLKDCEFYNSKIYTGSENGDGRIMVDGGFFDDTVAFFGSGCSLAFTPTNFFSALNPFDKTLRFKSDLTQVESMARIDYGISPPQWYHPLQFLTFPLVFGGCHVNDKVIAANNLYKKMFDDSEKDEAADRRLTRLYLYVQSTEFIENLSNPNFFPYMKVIGPNKIQDVDGTIYQIDSNGYFIKVSSDAKKGSSVNSDYASPEIKKRILSKHLLEKNGRMRKEEILKLKS